MAESKNIQNSKENTSQKNQFGANAPVADRDDTREQKVQNSGTGSMQAGRKPSTDSDSADSDTKIDDYEGQMDDEDIEEGWEANSQKGTENPRDQRV